MPTESPYDAVYSFRTPVLSSLSALLSSVVLFAGLAWLFTGFRFRPVSAVAYAQQFTLSVWGSFLLAAGLGTALAAIYWYPLRAPAAFRQYLHPSSVHFLSIALFSGAVYGAVAFLRLLVSMAVLLAVLVLLLGGPIAFLAGLSERDIPLTLTSLLALVFWVAAVRIVGLHDAGLAISHAATLYAVLTIGLCVVFLTPIAGESSVDEFPSDRSPQVILDESDGSTRDRSTGEGLLTRARSLFDAGRLRVARLPALWRSGDSDAVPTRRTATDEASVADDLDLDRLTPGGSCRATTAGGEPCSRDAQADARTCWQHDESDVPTDAPAADPVEVFDDVTVAGRSLAVCALAPTHASDETTVDAFQRAARRWEGIGKNAGIATVVERGDEPRPWVAFERGRGPITDHLDDLDRETRVDAVVEAADAVRTADMYNVSHGAVDPGVCYRVADPDRTVALSDWGVTAAVREAADDPPVTPFTAPEQFDGDGAGLPTDVYRLGALAYYLLTGTAPFADATDLRAAVGAGDLAPPSERDATLPAAVDDVIGAAMAVDPAERYDSPSAFRGALLRAME